ncbi:DEAD/DEAH box helicase [Succinatimonas hippei]|uniref:Helicase C-terminal domain protein n=1 Tax=Succinatimonas hippei (strain DSM 22608 / JCM 16073 / KCTC 15190 / YIT 12066) TaxID=762983 RepID=E8LIJ6_SUCHY|nr:hypothetical protein [Succinatimonas hippei]EFY07661.1 hypothetical protein HMPREF9444_00515 [Succinatimonas hippei YIT 12066]
MSVRVENIGNYQFAANGSSTNSNNMGMREMQARAFAKRDSQYLLIKAPPACGKSRALMFLALDKLVHQGIKKVIVAVPQMAIGSSFKDTDLISHGFFANWYVNPKYNLCGPDSDLSKSEKVLQFLDDPKESCLLCAHPTLIYFYDKLQDKSKLDKALIAIDEFHHVSADAGNRLGTVIRSLMHDTAAHIIAMTGSYFRGDSVPVLEAKDEEQFDKVTYTYYEQLNGYKYLKSLGINYAFYTGRWTDAVAEVLDTHKKTILHIPSVNSSESTKDKYNEVGNVFDIIGDVEFRDQKTGIYTLKTKDGRLLKVADLVTDDEWQGITLQSLREVTKRDDLDIIIALGMAKEGFDWPWCEVALTVGYRRSLTEVVQIIGRATRDCEGKSHAQFINLIRKPDALQDDVADSVNSLLKAITLSLLMEQVLVLNIHFRAASDPADKDDENAPTIVIDDSELNLSDTGKEILKEGIFDLTADVLNSEDIKNVLACEPNSLNNERVKEIIKCVLTEKFKDELLPQDIEAISQAIVIELNKKDIFNPKPSQNTTRGDGEKGAENIVDAPAPFVTEEGGTNFVDSNQHRFMNLDDLDINLIMQTNPFMGAYEFISKVVDAPTLKRIQDIAVSSRAHVTEEEALILWPSIKTFAARHNREPDVHSSDDYERRLGEVLAYIRNRKAQRLAAEQEA